MLSESVLNLIANRHCRRAFDNRPVDRALIERVLLAAANAPSSKNTQSWGVAVVSGESRDELSRKLCEAFDAGINPSPDYANRPKQPGEMMKKRETDYGAAMFEHYSVERSDDEAKRRHRRRNFVFFDAPVELIFHLPANAEPGNFLDIGLFMQTVILGLEVHGLGSCPQFSVASFSPVVHEHLGWSDKRTIVAGMAVGYFDAEKHENQFDPGRLGLDSFCQWYE